MGRAVYSLPPGPLIPNTPMLLSDLLSAIPRVDPTGDLPTGKREADLNLALLLLALDRGRAWDVRQREGWDIDADSQYTALPAGVRQVLHLKHTSPPYENMEPVSIETMESWGGRSTGRPYYYAFAGMDSTRQPLVWWWPTPDLDYTLQIRSHDVPRTMAATTDAVPAPDSAIDALVRFAALQLDRFQRYDPAQIAAARALWAEAHEQTV